MLHSFEWFRKYRKNPKHSDTRNIAVIILKIEQWGFIIDMRSKDADRVANSIDPDKEQSDLGLHCSPRPACPNT